MPALLYLDQPLWADTLFNGRAGAWREWRATVQQRRSSEVPAVAGEARCVVSPRADTAPLAVLAHMALSSL